MHMHPTFSQRLGLHSSGQVFEFLLDTLQDRLVTPGYLVNWEKVTANTQALEMTLHQLDYILTKPNIEVALFELIKRHKHVVEAIPAVLASREHTFVLVPIQSSQYLEVENYLFDSEAIKADADIYKIIKFCRTVGLLDFLTNVSISSFVDFVYGVEVGIDSNGRKNRGGKQMEKIIEYFLQTICQKHGFAYIPQVTHTKIKQFFSKDISLDKTGRIIDFVVSNGTTLFFIETNFYGSAGSKLKATASEYQQLYTSIHSHAACQFLWITDGRGWLTTKARLRETFDATDYILNLEMLARGVLEDILTS